MNGGAGFGVDESDSFDGGFEAEAKRLATTIRVVVHDTRASKSLLNQLNVKHQIRMLNTAHPFDRSNPLTHQGLVVLKVESPAASAASASVTLLGSQEEISNALNKYYGLADQTVETMLSTVSSASTMSTLSSMSNLSSLDSSAGSLGSLSSTDMTMSSMSMDSIDVDDAVARQGDDEDDDNC